MTNNWVDDVVVIRLSLLLSGLKHCWKLPGEPGDLAPEFELYDTIRESFEPSNRPLLKDFWMYNSFLQTAIRLSNGEILHASTSEDAATAEARLNLYKKEQKHLLVLIRRAAAYTFFTGHFASVGYLNGEKVIVPACAWSGDVDWDEEILIFEGQKYSHLRVVSTLQLTDDQHVLVRKYTRGETDVLQKRTGGPGRPTSMHIVAAEFDRRLAAGSVGEHLSVEAAHLAAWLKTTHPDELPLTAKTITNRLRGQFREHQRKAA